MTPAHTGAALKAAARADGSFQSWADASRP
jgi:hypothetical protein